MNWYEVWTNAAEAMEADDEIAAVMGDAIFLDGERAIEIPSMTALLVVNLEEEVFAPADWQFDPYTRTLDEIVQVEKALMRLFDQPLPVILGNAEFFSEFVAGQSLFGPERDQYFRRTLEFRFTPVRSRYYRPQLAGGS